MTERPDSVPRKLWFWLAAMLVLAFGWFEWITWTQYASHSVFLADVGVFDTICAGPRHGHFLRWPIEWNNGLSYFAVHFRPILLPIMALYFFVDHTMTFLTVLNIALVGAIIPLGIFAYGELKNTGLALAVCALYLCHHFVLSVHVANHPESLGFVSFFTMFVAVQRRSRWWFLGALLWTLAIKEDYALYCALFGVGLLCDPETRRWGTWTIVFAFLWAVYSQAVMKLSGTELLLAQGGTPASERFASFGSTKSEIFLGLLSQPGYIARHLFSITMLQLYASVGLIALLDRRTFWLAGAAAGMLLLAEDPVVGRLQFYYSYPAIPFLFFSLVRGLAFIKTRWGKYDRHLVPILTTVLILLAMISVPLKTRGENIRHFPLPISEHHRLAENVIAMIPPDASVAVQYDLYCQVPNRHTKLPFRLKYLDDAEYFLIDGKGRPLDLLGKEKASELEAINQRLESGEFETLFSEDGYYLLKKRNFQTDKNDSTDE